MGRSCPSKLLKLIHNWHDAWLKEVGSTNSSSQDTSIILTDIHIGNRKSLSGPFQALIHS